MTDDQSHVTKALAQFVSGSQWEAIPPEVRQEGVRGLLNFVGCALGGAQDRQWASRSRCWRRSSGRRRGS
jgi:2-methylcitrate dehydratase PrpD